LTKRKLELDTSIEKEKRAVFETTRDEYQTAQESVDGNSQLDKVSCIFILNKLINSKHNDNYSFILFVAFFLG
jgi:hypothetical protein